MAIGKSKRQPKKGQRTRQIDPMSKKEWYDFKAPVPFQAKSFGKTLVTKTTGTKIATEQIKGRVVESSLADIKENSDQLHWRKVKLIIDDVDGRNAKTSFYGMDITRDKLNYMIKKWQTLIDSFVVVKTADGFVMRIFTIAFTKRHPRMQTKKAYAQSSQIKQIRKTINDILTKELSKAKINQAVSYLVTQNDFFPEKIQKACQFIYPLQNVVIRKVKILKRPNIDAVKLNEMYTHEKKVGKEEPVQGEPQGDVEDEGAKNLLNKK